MLSHNTVNNVQCHKSNDIDIISTVQLVYLTILAFYDILNDVVHQYSRVSTTRQRATIQVIVSS